MAYYTGISGLQSLGNGGGDDPNIPRVQPSYTQLGQTNYNIAQPLAVQQNQQTAGFNPLMSGAQAPSPTPSNKNLQYAKTIDDVPDSVQQASQRYLSGASGYGDPSQSLFGRNLTGQYNQWTSQYGTPGQQFTPWALQTGATGGNYDPSKVDLFGSSLLGKTPQYSFNANKGSLSGVENYYNQFTGAQDISRTGHNISAPSLSRDYGSITPDYVKNQFADWTKLGATGLPAAGDYASQYYKSLMPSLNGSQGDIGNPRWSPEQRAEEERNNAGSGFYDWLIHGATSGLLGPAVDPAHFDMANYQSYLTNAARPAPNGRSNTGSPIRSTWMG